MRRVHAPSAPVHRDTQRDALQVHYPPNIYDSPAAGRMGCNVTLRRSTDEGASCGLVATLLWASCPRRGTTSQSAASGGDAYQPLFGFRSAITVTTFEAGECKLGGTGFQALRPRMDQVTISDTQV